MPGRTLKLRLNNLTPCSKNANTCLDGCAVLSKSLIWRTAPMQRTPKNREAVIGCGQLLENIETTGGKPPVFSYVIITSRCYPKSFHDFGRLCGAVQIFDLANSTHARDAQEPQSGDWLPPTAREHCTSVSSASSKYLDFKRLCCKKGGTK